MEHNKGSQPDATRPVLVVHTAVSYGYSQGLGIGLVQRVACAKTGRTQNDILQTQQRGLKVGVEEFAASRRNPHRRADMIALLKALHLAMDTIKNRWPKVTAPTTVVILLGRPCKEVMEIVTHHIEYGPESYKSLQAPHRSTVKQIIKRIDKIRRTGFRVSVAMSDHHDSGVQISAAKEAERRFKRACRDGRKLVAQKTRCNGAVNKDVSFELPIRENHAGNET